MIVHFVHYKTFEEAKRKWDERKRRINKDNMFIIFTDREGCTLEMIEEFDRLPYKNKIIFTNKKNLKIDSNVYVPGFDNDSAVGLVMDPLKTRPYYMCFDVIDIVKWFNKGVIKRRRI